MHYLYFSTTDFRRPKPVHPSRLHFYGTATYSSWKKENFFLPRYTIVVPTEASINTILKCFKDSISSYLQLLAGGRTLHFLQLYSRSNQVLTEGMQLLGCVRDEVSVFSNYTTGLFVRTQFNPPSFLHNPVTDSHAMKVVVSPP